MRKSFLILLMLLPINLLTVPVLFAEGPPKGCDQNYEIPQSIQERISEKEKQGELVLEIVTRDAQGYIYELFVNKELYLEGLFFYDEKAGKVIVCAINHAIESGHGTEGAFAWSIDQKDL